MRKVSVLSLAVLALAALAVPAAADESEEESREWNIEAYLDEAHSWGDLGVSVGPDFVAFDWTGLTLGDQASDDLRGVADGALSGEKDGEVDESELEDFTFGLQALFESQFGKYANHHAFSGFVLIDQAEAQEVTVTGVSAENLVGPVDQDAPISVSVGMNIAFPNVDDYKDVHTVRFDLGPYFIEKSHDESAESLAGDLELTIAGAEGWTIDADSIQPECAGESFVDGRLVFQGDDVDCFTGRDGVLLSFAINGQGEREENFLPGFELVALLGGLAGAFALCRRF